MKVLLLGVGMQGKATLHDLLQSEHVEEITAADYDLEGLESYVANRGWTPRVETAFVDGSDPESVRHLVSSGPDVVIDLMPVFYHDVVASAAVEQGCHLVNASYATPDMHRLSERARARGVTMLPEFGMDPGMDLVLLGEATRILDTVDGIITYGAGFPEPAVLDNPLDYKITWSVEGLLRSYYRAGRVIRHGEVVAFDETEMFSPEHTYEVELEGLGRLEAFPNGDALTYAELIGIDTTSLRNLGRYVLRWPGHCAFWKTLVDLHFLDEEPLVVNGAEVDRRDYLAALLGPQLQYEADERDVVVVRIEVEGEKDGARRRTVYQVIDRRDLTTGFTAMSRTVGYTASIGAQMLGTGDITKRGLLSPVTDVPYAPFVDELAKRGIDVTHEVMDIG